MSDIQFEWEPNKASSNIKKHGVSFDEAQSVFFDYHARIIPDPDSSFGEKRFIILGQSGDHRALVVCHCYREPDDTVRIISARKADKFEREKYEEYRYA